MTKLHYPRNGYVVVLSGGLDSTVLLGHLLEQGYYCRAMSVDYGQRHRRELGSAARVAKFYDVTHDVIDLSSLGHCLVGSALTDARVDVPRGHYEDASMKTTVVPNRNMVLLSVALSIAASANLHGVAYGAHAGDHAIYPDCRPVFVDAMRSAAQVCHYNRLHISAPLVDLDKGDIVRLGLEIEAPLQMTWTCYNGGDDPCGQCGSCVERAEAFADNGIPDPLTC